MKKLLRRLLHPVAASFVGLRSGDGPPISGNHCVIIAPHEDDEAFGCAGLILTRRAANVSVSIVYLTDGAGSHPHHPRLNPTAISQLRRTEAIQAMGKLNLTEDSLHFLEAPDGQLSRLSSLASTELTARFAALLVQLQPTELFLPCRHDSSTEHTGAFHLTHRALQLAHVTPRIFEYPIWARWRPQQLFWLALTYRQVWRLSFPRYAAAKRRALATYVSQTEPTPPWSAPVLPPGFIDCFSSADEYFFES
jgi:N-acetylglucosamine malate deacetylase 1